MSSSSFKALSVDTAALNKLCGNDIDLYTDSSMRHVDV
jgi:hypothetical protein